MKAVQYDRYGDPDVLRVVEIAAPDAGPGQIRIKVRAAGVNPFDWKLRAGLLQHFTPVRFPVGVGSEAAGIVDQLGHGVKNVAIGDAVFGVAVRRTAVAEYAVLTNWAHKPDPMPFDVAGALPVIAETSTRILDMISLSAGETLLVAGAAGGVGSAAIQLARYRGATVIGTASEVKHDYLRQLGAIPTTYEPGLAARVRLLAPQGVDAALDLVGVNIVPELVEIVGNSNHVVSIADFDAVLHGAQVTTSQGDHANLALARIAQIYSEGRFDLHLDGRFPFEQIAEAQVQSATGRVMGKLVISIP